MRILHTADWHLGRPFHHASLESDQRHVLQQLVNYANQHAVDAVIVAGDIYDRAVPPRWAVELLDEVLHQLCIEHDIPVVMIPGNHDGAERLGFGARHLQQANLHIVSSITDSTRSVTLQGRESDSAVVANIYCIPYCEPVQVSELAQKKLSDHNQAHSWLANEIKQTMDESACNILVSHCFVAGSEESESERRLSVGGADSVDVEPLLDFTYVALGHLHSPQRRTADSVRYSGSLLKYSFSEVNQHKGITLVEIDASNNVQTSLLPLIPQREVRVLEGTLDELLNKPEGHENADDYLLVRLQDKGALLNAMSRLREIYPNVLQLERTGLLGNTEQQPMSREKLARGELAMFRDFFKEMTGDQLATEEETALKEALESVQSTTGQTGET